MKVCGLTRVDDAVLAARLGAWALGFVFAVSPRRITPAGARALIDEARQRLSQPGVGPVLPGLVEADDASRPALPLTVGVFAGESAEEIAEVVELVGLDVVQLHGDADDAGSAAAAVRAALRSRCERSGRRPPLIIRAVPVPAAGTSAAGISGASVVASLLDAVAVAREAADVVLLDSKVAGLFGGTGAVFEWPLARQAAGEGRLLIAGGITPENVGRALAESGAWGVDASSGLERSPGVKDHEKLTRLFANVYGKVAGARAPGVWSRARAGVVTGAGDTQPSDAPAHAEERTPFLGRIET